MERRIVKKGNGMRWISAVACLAVAGMCLPVEAQVHRCKDAAGKTIYSDAPCTSGQTGQLIEREKSREQILEERLQAAQANERKYRMQDAEQSSKIYEQQRQSRPLNTQPPVRQNLASSRECKAAQKELEFVSSIRTLPQNEKRLRTNAAITNVNASCGSKTELMQEPPKVIVRPTNITHCDPGFCYDNNGGVYHKAGPDVMTGPNGRTCHRTGSMWNCN